MTRADLRAAAAGRPRRGRSARWLSPILAAVVVVALFAAIGWRLHDTGSSTGSAGNPASPLGWWANFPIDASPRPLVLTGPEIVDPAGGFPDGDAKLAYISGSFVLRATLPAKPPIVRGQRLSTAAEALAELRGAGSGKQAGPTPAPLAITAARLDTAPFSTDRGTRTLPAWSFRFAGVAGPAFVLAVPPADRWPHPGMPTGDVGGPTSVTVSADGTRATLSFIGPAAGTEPCEAEYAADVSQGKTAVAISLRQLSSPHKLTAPNIVCAGGGFSRTVTVSLQPPLGNRVLVDSRGVALGVTSVPPAAEGG